MLVGYIEILVNDYLVGLVELVEGVYDKYDEWPSTSENMECLITGEKLEELTIGEHLEIKKVLILKVMRNILTMISLVIKNW